MRASKFTGMVRLAGTRSFRLACGKMFGTFGTNTQNPDKDSLAMCVPGPGRSFLQADQEGAEAYVVAYQARPGNYRALFENGIKPHTFLAMHIFGEAYKDRWPFVDGHERYMTMSPAELAAEPGWKALNKAIKDSDKNPDKPYFIGKKTAHGKSYCMGAVTFQRSVLKESRGTMALTLAQSRAFLEMFDRLFPEVIELQGEIKEEVQRERVLYNLFGYPRRFERIFTESYLREIISFRPQSTVAIITALAAAKAQAYIESTGVDWHLLNNKHDSYLLSVPDADIETARALMTTWLAATLTGRDGMQFTMKSEVQVGKNWKPKSPYNPLGMS